MKGLNQALGFFVDQVTKSVGVYTAVIVIFLYHVVFERDFQCSCEIKALLCWFYMVLPALIIFVMLLWLDQSFQALVKYTCWKRTRFCLFLWLCIIRAVFIGLLWPVSVMIDGDWFTCCWHDAKLHCNNQTSEDQRINELKITSRIYGFGALLGIIFVAATLHLPWKECIRRCLKELCTLQGIRECCSLQGLSECCTCLNGCCTRCSIECCPHESDYMKKDVVFKKIVLEKGDSLVTELLTEVAKHKIGTKIQEYAAAEEWWKCYDVVEEIIGPPQHHNDSNSPLAEERGELWI